MSCFLDALNCKNKSRIPVWFMRQAGRYLPEYMEIKSKHNFKTMSTTPDLIKTITVQPLKRFDLDAAIIFSDILTPLSPMGADFDFESGPNLKSAGPDALTNLKNLDLNKMDFVKKAIGLILEEINIPLIGFIGAPFTLASYLVEGGSSKKREFRDTKKFMYENSSEFMKAMDHLSKELSCYVNYQIDSGVSVVQIFDSWGGILSIKDYDRFVAPSLEQLILNIKKDVPIIIYTQPCLHLLPILKKLPVNCINLDWRCSLSEARNLKKSIQGNLDPMLLVTSYDMTRGYVTDILDEAKNIGLERFIFNVGQGLTPQTKIDTIFKTIDEVHKYRS